MPTEKRSRDRTKERDKDKKSKDAARDKFEKSSDIYNDRKSSSRTNYISRSTKEKERDKDKDRERRDKREMEEEKERKKENEEKKHSSRRSRSERESSRTKSKKNNEYETKRKSSIKHEKIEKEVISIDNESSEISEENIKQSFINTTKSVIEDNYNYEDEEFEDYDEDFEDEDDEDAEDEEDEEDEENENIDIAQTEKKLDSGNYDVQPSRQASVRMQKELAAVKEAMIRENSMPKSSRLSSEMSDDSGRESPADRQTGKEEARKQSGFINFSAAKERNKVQIAAKAANSRGADLKKMIRLDIVNFDLFDLPSIRYTQIIYLKLLQRIHTGMRHL